MAEPDHFMATPPPYQVSESLRPRIDELDPRRGIEDLRDQGYTVVGDAAPPALLGMIGVHAFFGTATAVSGGVDMKKIVQCSLMSKQ